MSFPRKGDYIDIHNHGSIPEKGKFQVENLMTHENREPENTDYVTFTIGVHPWFLTSENLEQQIAIVAKYSTYHNIAAIGEAGFDRLKGPSQKIQENAFEEHVMIAEKVSKPLFIHCVRAWDDLLSVHKKLHSSKPWIIHGFRGKKELARQLIDKGMFLSFWFDFILKPESSVLIKSLPKERIFLETDGSGVDIKTIYNKVAADLEITVDDLKVQIYENFKEVFKI
jgi:TatD DNase family protein